ncbi:hypothetical protein AJ88_39025 [Mesorhizobium amorphae CCBAU 01583]|nr:hypothetical protein AJ88_39025 [Mesorhizobium amorphae CCBAU 01583]
MDDYAAFRLETDRLNALMQSTVSLSPAHRKFIAEIACLRLAILMENTIHLVCCKIVCGAPYLDGTAPAVLAVQRNIPKAVEAMQTFNRGGVFHKLKWNEGAGIRDNLAFLIDPADPIIGHLRNYGAFLTEVRYIRNHIAHRNDGTRKNFVKLIRRYYGARVRGVTVGNLLVSPRVATPPLLMGHIARARVMMKDLARA